MKNYRKRRRYTNSKQHKRCHKVNKKRYGTRNRFYKKRTRTSGSVSLMETTWLDSLNIIERQYPIKNFIVDGYEPSTNTVYEFLGDFWHGNPKKYKSNDIHPVRKVTFGELYRETIKRLKKLEKWGYTVVFIWECDYIKIS